MSYTSALLSIVFLLSPILAVAQELSQFRPQSRPEFQSPIYTSVVLPPEVAEMRPLARAEALPRTRWEGKPGTAIWTRAALSALKGHGQGMVNAVPNDIQEWCPAYKEQDLDGKRAFWVGLISALAKHESTYRPQVSGDSGKSHGLLQIRVPTAKLYKCRATSKAQLLKATNNLSCAIRIMNRTVVRDNAVGYRDGRWRGVAADWGPFVSPSKRSDMRAYVKRQPYCVPLSTQRPQLRPKTFDS